MREKRRTRNQTAALMFALLTLIAARSDAQPLPFVDTLSATDAAADDKQKLSTYEIAIPINTGDNRYGYAITELQIDFDSGGTGTNDITYVSMHRNSQSGGPLETAITHIPGASVPGYAGYFGRGASGQSATSAGVNVYTPRSSSFDGSATSEVYLDANTKYWLKIAASESGSTATLAQTLDANPTWPWKTGDIALRNQGSTGSWSLSQGSRSLKFKAMAKHLPKRTVTIEDANANEGTDEAVSFRVTLDQASNAHVQVPYYTSDETATADEDYTPQRGLLIFEPAWANGGTAETELTVSVPINDDATAEPSETLNLHLGVDEQYRGGVVGADLGNNKGVGTIADDDSSPLTATFTGMPETHNGMHKFSFDVEFTEEVGISYVTMRDTAFTVTEGEVKNARRKNGRHDQWTITVEPDGNDDMTITLPATNSCTDAGAVCTRGANARPLASSVSATIEGPDAEPVIVTGVTATLSNVPDEHDGTAFTFSLEFSEEVQAGYARIRNHLFDVTQGNVIRASRKTQGSNIGWNVRVQPTGTDDVRIETKTTTNCMPQHSICTTGGKRLTNAPSVVVPGPNGLTISDAEVTEADGARLVFTISLNRPVGERVYVDWATADGTAHAGSDYQNTTGRALILAGQTTRTIDVQVYDDSHNEGSETMTVQLSNATGATIIDATGSGTITNNDAMPSSLVARFGRSVAVHVVDQVEERVNAPRAPGFDGRIAGREINGDMGQQFALDFLQQLGGGYGQQQSQHGGQMTPSGTNDPRFGNGGMTSSLRPQGAIGGAMNPSASMQGLDPGQSYNQRMGIGLGGDGLLQGSSFALNRPTASGAILSFWSRSAQSSFYGQDGALALNGDVRTSMFGADYSKGRMVTGVSLSHSRGLGRYAGVDSGQVNSAVTGLYPWIVYKASERVTVWTVAGYGAGGLMLNPGAGTPIETGLSMAMAAGGGRGQILGGGEGFGLAFKADTLWVGMRTKAVSGPGGNLDSTTAAVSRLRTALEGSQSMTIASRMALTPSVEIGIRQDGGDAETGRGMDLGAGLVLADGVTGLAVDIRVQRLLVHQAEGFAESGMSISVSYNPTPSTPLGFTARVSPAWGGDAMSSAEALWGRESMSGMSHDPLMNGGGQRLDTEVGYGMPIGSRFVGTPRAGVRTSEYGRDYRIGYGMQVLEQGKLNLQLGIDAERRESPVFQMQEQGGSSDQRVLGRATVQW